MEQPTLLCIWMYICFKTNQMGRGLLLGQIPLSWNRCWFVCILQYISINLHQFSLHIFQCDCRWCIIYLQFVFIYLSSTSLPGGSWSVSDSAFGKVQVSSSDKKRIFPANTTDLVWCCHGRSQAKGMYLFIIYLFNFIYTRIKHQDLK